jgi:hypothetical protein
MGFGNMVCRIYVSFHYFGSPSRHDWRSVPNDVPACARHDNSCAASWDLSLRTRELVDDKAVHRPR